MKEEEDSPVGSSQRQFALSCPLSPRERVRVRESIPVLYFQTSILHLGGLNTEILEYTEVDSTTHKLRIKIDAATLAGAYETVLADLVKETDIPGFRRSHAPRKVFERHVGVKEIWEQARDKASEEALEEALKEKKLVAEEDAEFEREEYSGEGDYEFSATVVAKSS